MDVPTKQMSEPSWSPDGHKIVFWANSPNGGELFVADADGTNRIPLTQDPYGAYHPLWLPAN